MLINKPAPEDLTVLDLLISKLEESFNTSGIDVFNYNTYETTYDYENVVREDGSPISSDDVFPGYIKKVKLKFNSKGIFENTWGETHEYNGDCSDLKSVSTMNITWDSITNIIEISVGISDFEKHPNDPESLRRISHQTDSIAIDFGYEYRSDIMRMKVRLGKLYSKIKRDKIAEKNNKKRKDFAGAAINAFPDLFDPILLGGPK